MKMFNKQRAVALATLGVILGSLFGGAAVTPASADAKTWKKVAIGGAVLGGYGLLSGKGKLATVGGVVAVGSYLKYKHDKKSEKKRAAERRAAQQRAWAHSRGRKRGNAYGRRTNYRPQQRRVYYQTRYMSPSPHH